PASELAVDQAGFDVDVLEELGEATRDQRVHVFTIESALRGTLGDGRGRRFGDGFWGDRGRFGRRAAANQQSEQDQTRASHGARNMAQSALGGQKVRLGAAAAGPERSRKLRKSLFPPPWRLAVSKISLGRLGSLTPMGRACQRQPCARCQKESWSQSKGLTGQERPPRRALLPSV